MSAWRQWVRSDTFTLRTGTVRVLTLLALFGFPIGNFLEAQRDNAGTWLIIPSGVAILILLLSSATRLFDDSDVLDEFERNRRDKALRYAYATMVTVAGLIWVVSGFVGPIRLSSGTHFGLAYVIFTWMLILPIAIQAWFLRHPFADDELVEEEDA